ncbi:uncharacterized protein [Argopecten irradians]|uniref:uncharacterized protein n=1 Tax=Argopecten irradians TaxID=31199 RepID=UPI00371D4044
MGPKRRTNSTRSVSYDPELLENWTLARLRDELKKLGIAFRSTDRRMVLVNKVREARDTRRVQRSTSARSHDAPDNNQRNQDGGAHGQSTNHLAALVSSLAESVATLQDSYLRLENRISVSTDNSSCTTTRDSPAASCSTSNESQTLQLRSQQQVSVGSQDVPTDTRDYTLDSAYRQLTANRPEQSPSQDGPLQAAGSTSRHSSYPVPSNVVFDDELSSEINTLWDAALSNSTLATYRSGLNCFLTFILMQGITP